MDREQQRFQKDPHRGQSLTEELISIQIFFRVDDYEQANSHLAHHPTRHRRDTEPLYTTCYAFRICPELGKSLFVSMNTDGTGVVSHYHGIHPENAQLGWRLLEEIGAYNVIDEFTALEEGEYWDEFPVRGRH